MVLEQVAFDIETTGFDVDDVVTTVGFAVPMGVQVFVQSGEQEAAQLEAAVEAEVPDTLVNVSTVASERELLVAVSAFVTERFRDSDTLLVAYNGEKWKGGFDIPFLRTRYAQLGLDWPFEDVPYADVMPLITDRFNTTVDGEECGGLVTTYDVLCDGSYGELDPFDDSAEAVTAFEDGRVDALVLHNVSDVLRTRALGRVAERYCSKSDFNVKSLTPTRSI
ncbi:ribonuclease H-like domain-containing protein [Natranaeroarchaeum sulfidigenes]|uniref:YprB ribonuclease H-like domain-containing protein n=1 Tax=Natranaeroarchaeum sulfidigenes TaxID=2784880 RepID=A0A897MX50_9EURY|nr:ribonuclease H-like domain-containing protein [Natranaeroarchaeum sulfidigenes]QSG02905.1 Uncharacterized protein AArcS_1695 [Natranaeroarchaeum sulfidigenes]